MSTLPPVKRRIYPPMILALALVSMLCLHRFAPGVQLIGFPLRYAGVLIIFMALGLVLWSVGLFRRSGTTVLPFQQSSVLVRQGPYRFTRNPMYLGMTGFLIGIAVLLGSASPFLVVPLFVLLIDLRFIRLEEAMLLAKFGTPYADYRTRVRRWL